MITGAACRRRAADRLSGTAAAHRRARSGAHRRTVASPHPACAAVSRALSDLADALLQAALAVAAAELPATAAPARLGVIAMGKCGAVELNYVSDVDVIFIADHPSDVRPAPAGTRPRCWPPPPPWPSGLMRICGQAAWEVDAALRPEGKAGALVRTPAGHRAYYQKWAHTWEFQALLKARPAAGDLGARAGSSWTSPGPGCGPRRSASRSSTTCRRCAAGSRTTSRRPIGAGTQARRRRAARRRVRGATAAARARPRPTRRCGTPATLDALRRPDRRRLRRPRRRRRDWPRPTRSCAGSSICCNCSGCGAPTGCPSDRGGDALAGPGRRGTPGPGPRTRVEMFTAERVRHAATVRRLHEKLFYRPLLTAVAAVPDRRAAAVPGRRGARGSRRWASPRRPRRFGTSPR